MINKRTLLIMITLVTLSLLFITGCSQSKDQKATADKKTELVLAIASEPEGGFDPTTGWGRYGSPLFQSTLLKRDNTLKVVNDLATEYKVSDNGLEWTVKIRKDVKFSDGKPLTAADVKYTYETAAKNASVVDLTNLKSVEVVDDVTIKFTLNKAQSTFVDKLISTGIVPKHAHDKDYAQKPIGSGPFKFVQWDKGQQLIVESNPHYYGSKPQFTKLTFLFLSEDAILAAAKGGKVDMAVVPPALSKQKIQGMSLMAVDSVDNRGILFPYVKGGGKTDKGLDIGNDVTADIAIRKAINVAINRKALVDGVLEGQGTPAYTVCDGLPWWNPDSVIKDNDMNEAKKILADAGWKDTDGDGILEKSSLKAQFAMIYPAKDKTRQSLAISVADMIKPLGINVRTEGKSWDEIKKLAYSNAILFGWGSHSPLEMYDLFISKKAGIEYYNAGFYNNPAVDQYMERAMAATNEQEAMENWKKAQWDGTAGLSAKGDAPWAWLVNLKHCYFVRDTLDIGKPKIEPHGHGWPITDNIVEWRWK
ncbi:ABC transporter substrate-binding protein [Sporomusa malonica]|uniref:Peptide/nickel transport system substrate-binding protein n=1 Tax=Sporomusa malonica TaxID=112901 RepID=A0A1W2F3Z8_9FIRM|nr:ABC transporter substrate-binding protein [Sporomusa malonica]SMD16627.1 peptide/nickel transport system substrate-binding protein [Sporomusa malonica]